MPRLARAPPDAGRGRWRPRARRRRPASPRSRRAGASSPSSPPVAFPHSPTPTTVFLMRFAAYSATQAGEAPARLAQRRAPGQASASIAHRHLHSGLLDRRLVRPFAFDEPESARWIAARRSASEVAASSSRIDEAAADKAQPRPRRLDHAPAGCAQAGVDAENANYDRSSCNVREHQFPALRILRGVPHGDAPRRQRSGAGAGGGAAIRARLGVSTQAREFAVDRPQLSAAARTRPFPRPATPSPRARLSPGIVNGIRAAASSAPFSLMR